MQSKPGQARLSLRKPFTSACCKVCTPYSFPTDSCLSPQSNIHAAFRDAVHVWARYFATFHGSIDMKSLRSLVLALMLGAALPAYAIVPAHAQIAVDVSVEVAPPPLPYYEQPIIPAEGYIWVPGYWAWDPGESDYYWVPGTWVLPPQPEFLWTPAYWGWVGDRYIFHPGYWGREVGFYGGI